MAGGTQLGVPAPPHIIFILIYLHLNDGRDTSRHPRLQCARIQHCQGLGTPGVGMWGYTYECLCVERRLSTRRDGDCSDGHRERKTGSIRMVQLQHQKRKYSILARSTPLMTFTFPYDVKKHDRRRPEYHRQNIIKERGTGAYHGRR